jgi:hypothetical protein
MMGHVFCSCDATLTKAPFVRELAIEWAESKDDTRRRCGYLLLAELAKDHKDPALTDAFFEKYMDRIAKAIKKEENLVKEAMNSVIFAAGQPKRWRLPLSNLADQGGRDRAPARNVRGSSSHKPQRLRVLPTASTRRSHKLAATVWRTPASAGVPSLF